MSTLYRVECGIKNSMMVRTADMFDSLWEDRQSAVSYAEAIVQSRFDDDPRMADEGWTYETLFDDDGTVNITLYDKHDDEMQWWNIYPTQVKK